LVPFRKEVEETEQESEEGVASLREVFVEDKELWQRIKC
jgi:hypothetical protein